MPGQFRIAEGYVEVTADESGYDRAMDRLKSKKNEVRIGVQVDDREARARLDRIARGLFANVRLKVDDSALRRLRLKDIEVAVVPTIRDAALRTVQGQLDRLTADRVVNIRATADTRVAADEIRNLTQRRKVNIGIDVDTRVAADSLANLTRRRTMTVQARADTEAANTSLRFLTRDRNVNIRTRLSGIGGLASLGNDASSSAGGIGVLSSSIAKIAALVVGALPTIASLGQSLAAMGPAAALAAPAVLSLAAAFAAVKLGFSGIGGAFKAAFAPAEKSAAAAESATRKVENAQRSLAKAQQAVRDAEVNAAEARVRAAREIQDAQQNLKDTVEDTAEANVRAARDVQDAQQELRNTVQDVADAQRRAAEQVEQAERDLADAQRDARRAQQDLNDARKEAAEDLQDLNNRLAEAQLDQRQKVLDLQDAEKDLAAVKAKGAAASQSDLDKAQLRYDQAVQALSEQKTETARLQEQTDAANAAGVEGSEKVTKAKEDIADADEKVRDKTKELKDSQTEAAKAATDGAQRVAKAQRDVADAQSAAAKTAEDGAERVAKAQRDVADAQAAAAKAAVDGARQIADAQDAARQAAEALADAHRSGAQAADKVGDAMAKLAPNARAFVSAVLAQREAWRALKLDVQNTLFSGLGQKFTQMSTAILPSLRQGLTGTAGVLNLMARNAMGAVTNLGKTGQLKQLFAGLNDGLKPLSKVPGQFITGLAQIGIAAAPAFKRVTTAAGGFFARISKQIDTAAKNGHLEKIIDQALNVAKQFGHLIGDIFGTIGNVMKAAGNAGGDVLGSLGAVFKELRRITAMPEVQKALSTIFTAVNAIAKLVAGTLGQVIQAVLPLLAQLAPFVTQLAGKLGPVIGELLGSLGKALTPIMTALLPVLGEVGDVLVDVVKMLTPLLEPIGKLIGAILKAVAPFITLVGANLKTLIGALVTGLTPVINALIPAVGQFGQMFAQMAPMFAQVYPALLPLIPPLAQLSVSLLSLAMQVITPLMPLIVKLSGLLAGALASSLGAIVPRINEVIGGFTHFVNRTSQAVKWVIDKFKHLYDVLVGHSIIPDLVKAIISWFTKLWTKAKEIFNSLKNSVVDTWNRLWKAVTDRWNGFWSGLRNSMSNSKSWIGNWVSGLRTSVTNTWNSLWNGVSSKLSSGLSTLRSKLSDFKTWMLNAVKALRDGTGNLWSGIQSRFSGPVKWVISHVYNSGIRRMWNTIAGKINSKLTLPSISLGFNKGGIVPGKRSNKDTVPAMLAPGERVLSNAQVDHLGGHRGIDAILGKDRTTGTGGNPTSAQERKRHQPARGFADGGVIGKVTSSIGGAVSGAASWAKDLVIGGLKDAASKALRSLVQPLINQIPGSGIGNLLRGLANKAVGGMMGWFGNEDKKAVGGPAVQRALSWVRTQAGKPYQWGGNGNPSFDCSGLVSAVESVIRGESPHRRWATGAFGATAPSGWVRNLNSPFMIGITNAGVGHTAGTLAGVNVESRGGDGIVVGKRARGYNDSLFTSRWGFAPATKYDSGGLLQPGATMVMNKTGQPEAVLTPSEREAFQSLVRQGGGVSVELNMTVNCLTLPSPAERRRFAKDMADDMKEAIRKVEKARA
ncbi:hypothetical protein ACFWN1_17880 [Streptomyces sp. NPDC058459]|uniref:hypothetical protein n=1 Tax=Streptomyces sp. NPDC058459 TaxID=3346508 RepID=UPI00365866F4